METRIISPDIDSYVTVALVPDGSTILSGRLMQFYEGVGPIAIQRNGQKVIVPAERIAWVEAR